MSDVTLDDYDRITYTAKLGRKLHPDNAGALQWGPKYRDFHRRAWAEARRVLCVGGVFVLNIKDHYRNQRRMFVTDWHIECLRSLGFRLVDHVKVPTPAMRYGQNAEARIPYESLVLFRLEVKP